MNAWTNQVLNKKYAAAFIIVSILFLSPGAIFSGSEKKLFQDDTFDSFERGAVIFDHDQHSLMYDCAKCHHEYDEKGKLLEGVASTDLRCSDCHPQENEENSISLRRAYHIQCRDCHLEEAAGPFTCSECHVR